MTFHLNTRITVTSCFTYLSVHGVTAWVVVVSIGLC